MLQHDNDVGVLLDKLAELKIADNTIVLYTGDNGVHASTWPDAGVTWFRSEKTTNWEGAYRVPMLVRWPGNIPAGSVSNEIMAAIDWVPILIEKADIESNTYEDWWARRAFLIVPTQPLVGGFLASLKDYPPTQEPASFNLDRVFEEFLSRPAMQ